MIGINEIQRIVADNYEMTVEGMLSKSNLPVVVEPRQVSIYLCVKAGIRPFKGIEDEHRLKGGYEHSVRAVESCMDVDTLFRNRVMLIRDLAGIGLTREEKKRAVIDDIDKISRKLNSGNIGHIKLSLQQLALNIETLL